MSESARLKLPLLDPGQAQKEITHNEAIALLDIVVSPQVVAVEVNQPPAEPQDGACWIVGPAPTGAWTGFPGHIAGWTAGGWRFIAPFEGLVVHRAADAVPFRWQGAAWRAADIVANRVVVGGKPVLGERHAAIATPAGGTGIDAEARVAITAILAALRGHGLIEI